MVAPLNEGLSRLLHAEMVEWACNSQRGLEWPGSWPFYLGPMPDDWIKDKCQQADCPRCGKT